MSHSLLNIIVIIITFYKGGFLQFIIWVSRQLLPKKIATRLRLGFGSRSGLILGLGGNQTIAAEENRTPVRVRAWPRVSFGVGEQFPRGRLPLGTSFIDDPITNCS